MREAKGKVCGVYEVVREQLHAHIHAPRLYGVRLEPSGTASTATGQQLFGELALFFAACARDPLLQNAYSMRFGGGLHVMLADFRPEPDPSALAKFRTDLEELAEGVRDDCEGGRWNIPRDAVRLEMADDDACPHVQVVLEDGGAPLARLTTRLQKSIFPHREGKTGVFQPPLVADLLQSQESSGWPPTGPMPLARFAEVATDMPLVTALLSPHAPTASREEALDALAALRWQLCLVSRGVDGGVEVRTEATYVV